MFYTVKIKEIWSITFDVKEFTVNKPEGYTFKPGQATEVAINKPNWKGEKGLLPSHLYLKRSI
ncbi:MAG: hypothetical protein LAT68_06860 [Cyclobacteriaceae bacterium]|nr:hypothetical protein [Cyclobacteriaceae bacterium]